MRVSGTAEQAPDTAGQVSDTAELASGTAGQVSGTAELLPDKPELFPDTSGQLN